MVDLTNMKPCVLERSRIPRILSHLSPIEINAISLFPFVFCRGKISETTRRHETIHFQQQLETLVIGFYIIYLWDYLKARLVKRLPGPEAYRSLRAEREAYENQDNKDYLNTRKRYRWLRG